MASRGKMQGLRGMSAALGMAVLAVPIQNSGALAQEATMITGPQGRLAVTQRGEGGIPVLFLHGDSSRASQWEAVMQLLAPMNRTITFDFRGHGESDPAANDDYSYEGRAEDIGAVAEALNLASFAIVAHSGGNGAALAYAAANAVRVAGILMVDPPTDPRRLPQEVRDGFVKELAGPDSMQVQKAYFSSIAGSVQATRSRVLRDAESVHPTARLGVGQAIAEWNPETTLYAYGGPMLVLASDANDNAGALYRLRSDLPHEVIRGAGHWLHLDRPEEVAEAVRTFMADIEAESPNR